MAEPTSTAPVYTYAVARRFDPARLGGLRGVDGALVGVVAHREIVAVVSPLPPGAIDPAALRRRLEDLAELETIARIHHAVVHAVTALSVTVPFRLATIHHDEGRVVDLLRQGYRRFGAALDRCAGRVELGVKVYAMAGLAPEPGRVGAAVPAVVSPNPGRDYLRRRREQTHRREGAWHRATAFAQRLDAELAALADDCQYHRPQDPQLSGVAGENVLNAAYLVDDGRADVFAARVDALDAEAEGAGASVVVTGPWAPYSFAVVSDGPPDGETEAAPGDSFGWSA
jgi:Gas vesicle synthesis protein GvpL/GvpF